MYTRMLVVFATVSVKVISSFSAAVVLSALMAEIVGAASAGSLTSRIGGFVASTKDAAGAVAAMVVSPLVTLIVPAAKPFAVAVIFITPEAPSCFTTQRHFPLNAACVLPESFSTFAP